jgi:hypothetical protein
MYVRRAGLLFYCASCLRLSSLILYIAKTCKDVAGKVTRHAQAILNKPENWSEKNV